MAESELLSIRIIRLEALRSPLEKESELDTLKSVVIPNGSDRVISLQDLIDGWGMETVTLIDAASRHDDLARNAHDYVGALYLRNRISNAIDDLSDKRLQGLAAAALKPLDSAFIESTNLDTENIVRRFNGEDDNFSAFWWWGRLPNQGSIRNEFEEWNAQAINPG